MTHAKSVFPCQYPKCREGGEYSLIVADRAVKYFCRSHAKQMVNAGAILLHFPPRGDV